MKKFCSKLCRYLIDVFFFAFSVWLEHLLINFKIILIFDLTNLFMWKNLHHKSCKFSLFIAPILTFFCFLCQCCLFLISTSILFNFFFLLFLLSNTQYIIILLRYGYNLNFICGTFNKFSTSVVKDELLDITHYYFASWPTM